jgi:hypothetical protein
MYRYKTCDIQLLNRIRQQFSHSTPRKREDTKVTYMCPPSAGVASLMQKRQPEAP